MGKLLTNHIGYECTGKKRAVYQGCADDGAGKFTVANAAGKTVFSGAAVECGAVARWNTGHYWVLDFSGLDAPGNYAIELQTAKGKVVSSLFEISGHLLRMRLISALGYYFKAQRASGEWEREDSRLPFAGKREGVVDARGGWYDATGDYGIHLSHLSHSTYYNPQQAAMSAYTFFKAAELLDKAGNMQYSMVKRRLLDEGVFGADFIMRRRAPSGSFFRSVKRAGALDGVEGTRCIDFEYRGSSAQFSEIAATAAVETITDDNYEASLRSGGGACIAALAAAGRHYYPCGDFSQPEYVKAAKKAWSYLKKNNERYTNNGRWNLIDEYCALLALTELYKTTREYEYYASAQTMARRIMNRIVLLSDRFARLETEAGVPFHHPSDEGMPVIALLEYADMEPDRAAKLAAVEACEKLMRHTLDITEQCVNPFNYPRFEYLEGGEVTAKFFFPHNTTAQPWWQGENARIACLSAAARMLAYRTEDAELARRLEIFAEDQINWILGLNPFDSSMMEGFGRNHIQYFFRGRYDFLNCPGGIVNGITSGLHDEEGIEFVMEPTGEINDNWRWAEQWLPHAAWFMYALAVKP